MAERESKFFKIYFILMIVYAILGLLDALVFTGAKETAGQISNLYLLFIGILIPLGIFILSIVALTIFIRSKFAKITLVIPIYHIIATILIVGYGIVWGIVMVMQGVEASGQLIPPGLVLIGIISSLFELIFSSYILYKFR